MMAARLCGVALAAALLVDGPSTSAAAPEDLVLEMDMSFLGMTVGRAELSTQVQAEEVTQDLLVETVGLARELTGFSSASHSLSRLDGTRPRTLSFDFETESKRSNRRVMIRYDGDGRVIDLATFKRGKEEPSEVPAALRDGTVDPLAAFTAIRGWLFSARDGGPDTTRFAVFDGRRRYDLAVRLVERRDADFDTGPTPIFELEVLLRPLAGFDDGDREERRLVVLVSDDEAMVPLVMRTRVQGGLQAALYTRRACVGNEECRSFSY